MTLEEYKRKSGQSIKNSNYLKSLITRILICFIIILSILIITNISKTAKTFIKKNLFDTSFKFSTINKLYNDYILNIKGKDNDKKDTINVNKDINYKSIEKYNDGAKLIVDKNYPVKLLKSGIVVFIGEKEKYGNTIIVQQSNGIDVWYGNITDVNVKLYDYIEKDTIIGNCNETLYLVFQKDGLFQDYNEFIK